MAIRQARGSPSTAAPDAIAVPVTIVGPTPTGGPPDDWHGGLYRRVVSALYALPSLFKTNLSISGVRATDLYALNSALGNSIEESVVNNLNALRSVWDPEGVFQIYAFVRQQQVFPDVILYTPDPGVHDRILMGIELKGWFALAKEGEQSFRYAVTPAACAPADLLVVFPWILDEIVSGRPRLLQPFVTEARFAAEHRNHYWSVLRGVTGMATAITVAAHQAPYPKKSDKFNDAAQLDSGNNFGRVARGGIMAGFISGIMQQPTAGIPLGAWQRFFKIFSEGFTEESLTNQLKQIRANFAASINDSPESKSAFDNFSESLARLLVTVDRNE